MTVATLGYTMVICGNSNDPHHRYRGRIEKFTTLTISNATREDFGQYRIVVENNIGSDSATITVTVADGPDPPRFPIVENVLDEAIILSWKTPELDGGSMITKYNFGMLRFN